MGSSTLSLSLDLNLYLVGVVTNLLRTLELQISSKCTSYSSARTDALMKSSYEIYLWHLNVLLKERVIWKINALIWFCWMKKTSSLIEDKRKDKAQRAYMHRNPKRHIPLVSLLLWSKMVAVLSFTWPLALQLWSVRQAVRQFVRLKFEF